MAESLENRVEVLERLVTELQYEIQDLKRLTKTSHLRVRNLKRKEIPDGVGDVPLAPVRAPGEINS